MKILSSCPFVKFCVLVCFFNFSVTPVVAQHNESEHFSGISQSCVNADNHTDPVHPEVKAVMKRNYQASREFFRGNAAVMLDGKWGFIDRNGNEILSTQFDFVCDFWESSTMAKKAEHWLLIDEKGNVLKKFDIDFFDGFRNGKAKIIKKRQIAYIDPSGMILAPGWTPDVQVRRPAPSVSLNNINTGCPDNIDFEFGDYRIWTSSVGSVGCVSNVYSLSGMNVVNPPYVNHIELIPNDPGLPLDHYGGFPITPPDGSEFAIKLGNDNEETPGLPDARAESIEYDFWVPQAPNNFNIIYDYAVVLDEPTNAVHTPCEKPRLSVTFIDVATSQIIPCGYVEYYADPSFAGTGGFIQSSIPIPALGHGASGRVWYKPWTSTFVNLSKYPNKQIKVVFKVNDCTRRGHWGYAYLDIRGCETALKAYNNCRNPRRTILEGPPGFGIYKWYDANYGTLLANSRYSVLNSQLPAGSAVHLVYALDSSSGCIDTLHGIVINSQFNWNAGPDKSMCPGSGESVRIGSPPSANILYNWSPGAHLSATNQAQVTATPPNDFRYIVTATDTLTGCELRDTVFVRMDPKPNIRVNDLVLCKGQEGNLTASGASEYFWTPNSTLFVNQGNNATAIARPANSGNYTYYVRGNTRGSRCYGRDTAIVTVYPRPDVTINGPGTSDICQGQSVPLQAQGTFNSSVQWYYDNDITDLNPPTMIPGGNLLNLNASNSGTYYVTFTNAFGCHDTAAHPLLINVIPKPVPDFSFPSYCENRPIQFNNTSLVSNSSQVSYEWSFGDNSPVSNAENPVHVFSPAGNYTVTLKVIPSLCPSLFETRSLLIPVEAPVPGIRYPNVYTVRNSNRQLQARMFAVDYLWTPSTGLSNATISNPLFNYGDSMKYLINLRTVSGCETVDTQHVYIRREIDIRVPTAFTPNGDGHNDVLDIFLVDIKVLKWFRVFNRWGQLLFETNDPRQRWDGTFKGVKQPAETYVWTAQGEGIDGREVIRRGQCVLLR